MIGKQNKKDSPRISPAECGVEDVHGMDGEKKRGKKSDIIIKLLSPDSPDKINGHYSDNEYGQS
jgi:hypothetical protein